MTITKSGITIDDKDWYNATPQPSNNVEQSSITVNLQDSPPLHLSEKFLVHALALLVSDALAQDKDECANRIKKIIDDI